VTSSGPVDDNAFRAFEHAGWEKAATDYHDTFTPLTIQTAEPLLDAAQVRSGTRVLDVATGPGYVAAGAAQRGAEVTGVDFSAAMVALARRQHPSIEFQVGDAEALPLPDAGFDAVVMNFGLLHLARPQRALEEAHRVLRTGGRIAFTVWAGPDKAVAFGIILRAIESHGRLDVPLPPGPPFFQFSDPRECHRALSEAGFAATAVVQLPLVWRVRSPEALLDAMWGGTVRTAGLLRAQSPEALERIREAVITGAEAYRTGEGIELPMPAILASAGKP
jgi:SAM-dependent methyltransferase